MSHTAELNHDMSSNTTLFGFWVYIMTDCVLFASLFAAYAVLRNSTFGNASGHDIFNLPFVLTETLILLTSSFTCGLAILAAHRQAKAEVLGWLAATFALGAAFLTMELSEFRHLIADGHSYQASAFLSSFFSLVSTHGLHIFAGLLTLLVVTAFIIRRGLTPEVVRNLTCFSIFWHFLDIVWIFIFTIVYLMGVI
jgi:cytochrome o ubiquinol oxidase subunit 3